jgi:hypothetical protein
MRYSVHCCLRVSSTGLGDTNSQHLALGDGFQLDFSSSTESVINRITKLRKNMKNKLLPLVDKLLLCKRSIIETVNDQLKNISQIEHSRHRSPFNFFVNLIAGLVAYTFREKKPSLNIRLPQALPAVVL